MAVEIVINATHEETRVAILENKVVTEFYIDRKKDRGIVGNVYKGKVVKVLPGMQAAFVDIGVEKAAFLYVSEVSSGAGDYEKYFLEERTDEEGETSSEFRETETEEEVEPLQEKPSESQDVQPEDREKIVESVFVSENPSSGQENPSVDSFMIETEQLSYSTESVVASEDRPSESEAVSVEEPPFLEEILGQDSPEEDAAANVLSEANLDGPIGIETNPPVPSETETGVPRMESSESKGIQPKTGRSGGQSRGKNRSRHFKARSKSRRSSRGIEDLLKEGQEILVQVSKDAMGTKGPRVTTYVSLPGRYLVYMPTVNHIGISRRIGGSEERGRLKELLHRLRKPGSGYIIRTVSEGTTEEEFKSDMEFLELLWQSMLKKKEKSVAPALLHIDLDLIFRTVRDLFTKKVDRLVIDSKNEYERIKDYAQMYLQELSTRVELYTKEEPIFDAYEVETEISRALARKVWLKSGGYLVIDRTEALTVIDVNTGRYVGKKDLEETILRTNLEALKEIAYQLRLRNIGGIIIIDFIDMEKEKNREKIFQSLQEAMSKDKARINILKISELGLIELSRERTRDDIQRILCEPCHYCEGRSYTRSAATICYEIFREIRRIGASPREKKIIIMANPEVTNLLYDEERQGIEELEKCFKKRIIVKPDHGMHVEHYNVTMV
ncbi:MAG: ribonuclease E/G [Nitrospiria bacterium]